MQLNIKKLHEDAIIPTYATPGSACFDLYAVEVEENTRLINGKPQTFRTGLSFEIPAGYVMLVFSRSGHGFNYSTRLSNCVGVIDSDYRGEVMVRLIRDTDSLTSPNFFNSGDRVAQAMLVPVEQVVFFETEGLTETVRGTDGFGSTGE